MDAKAFGRAKEYSMSVESVTESQMTYNPIAFAKFKKPSSVRTAGELKPETMT